MVVVLFFFLLFGLIIVLLAIKSVYDKIQGPKEDNKLSRQLTDQEVEDE